MEIIRLSLTGLDDDWQIFVLSFLIWLRKTSIITFSRHSIFYPHLSYGRRNLMNSRRTLSESYIFATIEGFGIGPPFTHNGSSELFTTRPVGIADLD